MTTHIGIMIVIMLWKIKYFILIKIIFCQAPNHQGRINLLIYLLLSYSCLQKFYCKNNGKPFFSGWGAYFGHYFNHCSPVIHSCSHMPPITNINQHMYTQFKFDLLSLNLNLRIQIRIFFSNSKLFAPALHTFTISTYLIYFQINYFQEADTPSFVI